MSPPLATLCSTSPAEKLPCQKPIRRRSTLLADTRSSTLQNPESLRELVHRLHEGIYVTTRKGEILDANPAFLQMFGMSSLEEMRSHDAADFLVDPAQRQREIELLDREGSLREFELQIRRADGQVRTVIDSAFAVTDPETKEIVYHGILVDITDRKRLEEQLLEQSIRDPLTGCFNRRYLDEFEQKMIKRGGGWSCIVLDVDHFKEYNDRFGHIVGDEVLTRVARFLMRQTRAEEGVVRLGGDEFVVLLAGCDPESAEKAAVRLHQLGSREVPIVFSLGWAARLDDEKLDRTIARADQNLLAVRSHDRSGDLERRRP
jgi:diguanylate cyclase (GGDEF)-like protein/PAS domain S-box-containing protein